VPIFCRHNRFTADCPICSKGTVLEQPKRRSSGASGARSPRKRAERAAAPTYRGPYASVGPYTDEKGETYEVRLERVPGGLRLAEWAGGVLRRSAPTTEARDLVSIVLDAARRELITDAEAGIVGAALEEATPAPAEPAARGVSAGRAGELRDELRVERDGDRVRVARWVHRPGTGWELREAPVMMPAGRLVEAVADAARRGVLASGDAGAARP
jgi:hypothetical protein